MTDITLEMIDDLQKVLGIHYTLKKYDDYYDIITPFTLPDGKQIKLCLEKTSGGRILVGDFGYIYSTFMSKNLGKMGVNCFNMVKIDIMENNLLGVMGRENDNEEIYAKTTNLYHTPTLVYKMIGFITTMANLIETLN